MARELWVQPKLGGGCSVSEKHQYKLEHEHQQRLVVAERATDTEEQRLHDVTAGEN